MIPQNRAIMCPRCGTALPAEARRCTSCGTHIDPLQPRRDQLERSAKPVRMDATESRAPQVSFWRLLSLARHTKLLVIAGFLIYAGLETGHTGSALTILALVAGFYAVRWLLSD